MKSAKSGFLGYIWTLALFLSLGCGVSTLGVATPAPNPTATSEDNPTTGAIVRSTREAKATLASQSTATRQAALDATASSLTLTAEARASATAEAIGWATARAISTVQADWPPLLADPFTDNHLGWPIGITRDNSLSVVAALLDGTYQWTVLVQSGNSYFNLVPAKSPTLDSFYAAVSIQFPANSGDGESAYGLAFRHVDDDYGFFGIEPSGQFRILEVHHTGIYQFLESSTSAFDTRPSHVNRIAVAAIGSDFVFMVNGQVVGRLSADIAPGQVGLGVDTLARASEARVIFSDFEIRAP